MLIMIILFDTACLKRVAVDPGSERIAQADFVEVITNSGEKIVLKNVKLYEDFMEGEHRREIIRINFDEIQSVEVVNRDYRKVLTYYLIGFGIAIGIGYLLRGWDGKPWFD